jgi:hypothetical protein
MAPFLSPLLDTWALHVRLIPFLPAPPLPAASLLTPSRHQDPNLEMPPWLLYTPTLIPPLKPLHNPRPSMALIILNTNSCHPTSACPHRPPTPIKGGDPCPFSPHLPLLFSLPSMLVCCHWQVPLSPLLHHRRPVTTRPPHAPLSLFHPCR